jgi:hypothetical protein
MGVPPRRQVVRVEAASALPALKKAAADRIPTRVTNRAIAAITGGRRSRQASGAVVTSGMGQHLPPAYRTLLNGPARRRRIELHPLEECTGIE